MPGHPVQCCSRLKAAGYGYEVYPAVHHNHCHPLDVNIVSSWPQLLNTHGAIERIIFEKLSVKEVEILTAKIS